MTVSQRLSLIALVGAGLMLLHSAGMASESGPASAPSGDAPATLSLEQAIEIALRNNPQVGIAEDAVWAVRARVTQAKSLLMPRLTLSTRRVTPVNLPAFSFQSGETTYETEFSASQPLYTAGSLRKGVAAARSLLRGAEGAWERAQQQVAYLVRQAYYGVLTAEEGVKVAQEVLGSAKEHLRVAGLRYEAGVAPQYDVLAAEARVARVEQELISAESGRDIAWASLATVMGAHLAAGTELSMPGPVAVTKGSVAELTEEALANRPDLRSVQAQRVAGEAQVHVARAARQPTVSAAATYTLREDLAIPGEQFGLPPGTELLVSQSSGYLVLAATWQLFNAGQVFADIRGAEASLRQAQKAVRSLELEIGLDVKSSYYSLEAAQAQLEAARKEVDQAQEAHRIAKLRYEEGVGTSVEILDAEANLEGAKTRLNQAAYGLNLAVAQLDLALGRSPAAAAPATPGAAAEPSGG